ncbi:hypothetical protein BKA66DRAFT_412106 [Pyrenochaeta sp. MPI-SDFR-AT-0127]|nr:hypothetical protein BKA66DRAFT_412106 [Pyrenochaeta sp. MPI-SDFR-AT-0127]
MSCNAFSQIPAPPTTLPSCAVPIGGSNSSILDACCNGHINAIATYSDPKADANLEDDDGCFQYCTTDSPANVEACLSQKLAEYATSGPKFECFNVNVEGVRKGGSGGYSSAGGRVRVKGWVMGVVLGMGFVGAVVGI